MRLLCCVASLPYIVAAKFHSGIRSKVRSARWIRLKDGVEVCETRHVIGSFGKQRRLILVRKDAGRLPLSTGRQLEIWEDSPSRSMGGGEAIMPQGGDEG